MIWVSLMLGIFNESKALHATCEVIYGSLEQDLAMSSYADDVSRISLGQCNWARYLGERVHYAGRTHEEVALRLQASKGAWTRMGSFWFRPGATRSKLLVYKALVQSTLLSGIEVLVVEKQKISKSTGSFCVQDGSCFKDVLATRNYKVVAACGIQHVPRKQFARCWDCAQLILSSECED